MSASRGGFTLMEVLVGMTVAALALMAGFAAIGFVRDRADAAELATVEALQGVGTRSLLVDWLSAAQMQAPGRAGRFQGIDAESENLESDELVFPTTARTPLRVRNTVVRLYIDRDDETPEQGLVAELWERPQDEHRRIELVPQAVQMDLRYRPEGDDGFEWLEAWTARNRMPRAIEITLHAAPGDSLPALLRLPIRVPLAQR